jgi:hypothetical protein
MVVKKATATPKMRLEPRRNRRASAFAQQQGSGVSGRSSILSNPPNPTNQNQTVLHPSPEKPKERFCGAS